MAGKKRAIPRKMSRNSKPTVAVYPATTLTMATRNLLNMAAVCASSATILLCLMIVKRF